MWVGSYVKTTAKTFYKADSCPLISWFLEFFLLTTALLTSSGGFFFTPHPPPRFF